MCIVIALAFAVMSAALDPGIIAQVDTSSFHL